MKGESDLRPQTSDLRPANPINPSFFGKDFPADGKRFVILRVFVVNWGRALPQRREDAKNLRV